MKIILASNSPRRKELLENIGLSFEVISSNIIEEMDEKQSPEIIAMDLAYQKAKNIAQILKGNEIIIAADTIVVNEDILGKPQTKEQAFNMLKSLSNKQHLVITGFAIIQSSTDKKIIDYAKTKVYFRNIMDEEIIRYIETGESMDKAGAYGIQGKGALFVDKIEGDYYNVVGIPLCKIAKILNIEFGIKLI